MPMYQVSRNLKSHLLPVLLFLAFLAQGAAGQSKRPAAVTPPEEIYGGIEIGAKGIKALVLRITGEDEAYTVKIINAEIINTTLVQTKEGKFTAEAIRETGQVVQRFFLRMQQEFRVPVGHIHIVGSSGLIGDNPQDIIDEVKRKTGYNMTFLDLDSEVQLSIAGTIPKRYRVGQTWYDNRGISLLVDIGSGNTKGGYQLMRQVAVGRPEYDFVTWGIPKGTVTFTNDVNKAVGETADYQAFARKSQALSSETLRSMIRTEVSRKPGLFNRKKIYLSGGIIWAMETLLHPEDRRSFTPVTTDDISNFYNRAISDPEGLLNPDLSTIRDPSVRQEAEREVESVRNTFTPKNLIAGAELIKAASTELSFPGKRLIFARFGHLAWILSYVRLQVE